MERLLIPKKLVSTAPHDTVGGQLDPRRRGLRRGGIARGHDLLLGGHLRAVHAGSDQPPQKRQMPSRKRLGSAAPTPRLTALQTNRRKPGMNDLTHCRGISGKRRYADSANSST